MKRMLILMLVPLILACGGYDEEALEDRITILETEHKRHRHVDSSGKDTSEPVIRAVAVTGRKIPANAKDDAIGTDGAPPRPMMLNPTSQKTIL